MTDMRKFLNALNEGQLTPLKRIDNINVSVADDGAVILSQNVGGNQSIYVEKQNIHDLVYALIGVLKH